MSFSFGTPQSNSARSPMPLGAPVFLNQQYYSFQLFTNKFVWCHKTDVQVCTVSGGTATFGTPYSTDGAYQAYGTPGAKMSDTRFVAFGSASGGGAFKFYVCDVSGTTITPLATQTLSVGGGAVTGQGSVIGLTSTKFMFVADYDNTGAQKGTAWIGTYSGGSITFGSPYVFDAGGGGVSSYMCMCWKSSTVVEIYWQDMSTGSPRPFQVVKATISGSVISYGTTHSVTGYAGTAAEGSTVGGAVSIDPSDPTSNTIVAFTRNAAFGNLGLVALLDVENASITRHDIQNFSGANKAIAVHAVMMATNWLAIYAADGVASPNTGSYMYDAQVVGTAFGAFTTSNLTSIDVDDTPRGLFFLDTNEVGITVQDQDSSEDPTFVFATGTGPAPPTTYTQKVLGMATGKGSGAKLYVTTWQDGQIALHEYTYPGLVKSNSYSLGNATESEVDARTWWAYPFTLLGDDDKLVIFGRMNDPGGLGTVHLLYSEDAGASVASIEAGFGSDHIGAVIDDPTGTLIFCVRNISGSSPKLYYGYPNGALSLLSTIALDGGVNPQALRFDFNNNIIAGVDTGTTVMIVYSPPPFVAWYDFTFNHGTAAGINSVIVL